MSLESTTAQPSAIELFRERHSDWIQARVDAGDVLYRIPSGRFFAQSLALFVLSDADKEAEAELVNVCNGHGVIGVYENQLISHPLFADPLPMISADAFDMSGLGWNERDVFKLSSALMSTKVPHHRMRASLGRLMVHARFRLAADQLRRQWWELSNRLRPPLPLHRPAQLPVAIRRAVETPTYRKASVEVAEFWQAFDAFLDKWELTGMATWELPMPCGPLDNLALPVSTVAGAYNFVSRYPWHYPLLDSDDAGETMMDSHRQRAKLYGVKDGMHWESYAHMASILHWESVLGKRYPKSQRVHKFVGSLIQLLADMIGLSTERVEKLRKDARALQSGRKKQLGSRSQ